MSRKVGDSGSQDVERDEAAIEEEPKYRIRVEDLEPGQELNGLVSGVAPFGAFVDIGGNSEGLVHLSQISKGFVDDINNFVEPGQIVKVRVLEVSADGKLSLTMLEDEDERSSDLSAFETLSTEDWVDAEVYGFTPYSAFVMVTPPGGGPPVKGQVHVSQIKDGFVETPADELEIGQSVRVRVESVDVAKRKLALSMRKPFVHHEQGQLQDVSAFLSVTQDEWFAGRVEHTMHFGVFVSIPKPDGEGTAKGLVYVSEMQEARVVDPALVVTVGQKVRVRIIDVETERGRLYLSMKDPITPAE